MRSLLSSLMDRLRRWSGDPSSSDPWGAAAARLGLEQVHEGGTIQGRPVWFRGVVDGVPVRVQELDDERAVGEPFRPRHSGAARALVTPARPSAEALGKATC
jgi:hypothetical protein